MYIGAFHPISTTNLVGAVSGSYFLYVFHQHAPRESRQSDFIFCSVLFCSVSCFFVFTLRSPRDLRPLPMSMLARRSISLSIHHQGRIDPRSPYLLYHYQNHLDRTNERAALARVQFAQYLTAALCLVLGVYAYSFLFPSDYTTTKARLGAACCLVTIGRSAPRLLL